MTDLVPHASARILAVVDHTTSRGDVPWMARWWRTGEFLVPFDAGVDDPTWGLLMAELFEMLGEDDDHTPAQILDRALTKLPWALYPGLKVETDDGRMVCAGCCASLSDWRDWYGLLDGAAPNLGHDPDVVAWREGGLVVFKSHSASPAQSEMFGEPDVIAMTSARFQEALGEVEAQLAAVAARVETWSAGYGGPGLGRRVASGFRQSFGLTA